jgi:thymidine kinase
MKTGKITLILGSMMSSKSSVLLEYIDRAQYANKKSCLVRPKTDTRKYISRKGLNPKDKTWIYQLDTLHEITFDNFDLICIDEGQFIDETREKSHLLRWDMKVSQI